MKKTFYPIFFVLLPAGLMYSGCTPGPRPIAVGEDACAHCLMTVSDARYATELVTPTGKVHVFDSVECLAAHLDEEAPDVYSLWVTDFYAPETLLAAEEAFFLYGSTLHSPMGGHLAAFRPEFIETAAQDFGGEILDWPAVRALAEPPMHSTSIKR